MKRIIFAAVAALATISAGSAGSSPIAPTPAEVIQRTAVVRNLDDCQLAYFSRCLAVWGDYGGCYAAAQSYECPPG